MENTSNPLSCLSEKNTLGLRALLSILLCTSAVLFSCAESDENVVTTQAGECPQGKCDRVSDEVQELYSDMKRINLDD